LSLSTEEVESLIRYIEEHKEEVMAVHRQIEERIARGNPPEVEAKLEKSRPRFLARLAELLYKRAGVKPTRANNPADIAAYPDDPLRNPPPGTELLPAV
jgi:hypothetical protein